MKTLLKIIASVFLIAVLVIAVGGYIFLKKFDLNSYKTTIEQMAYEQTGRKLTIDGNAHLGISLIPTLVLDDISFANAAWSTQPQMLQLESLQIQIAVMPLLQKEIVIKGINLISPKIYLEKSKTGMVNWDFSKAEKVSANRQTLGFAQLEASTAAPDTPLSNSPLPDFIKNISVKQINIQNGFVSYFDAASGQTQEIGLNEVSLNMDSLDSPINAVLNVSYQNQPINATLALGSFNDFFAADTPFAVDVTAQAYNINAAIKGFMQNITADLSYDLNANIYSPAGNFNLPETTLETALKGNLSRITADIKTLNVVNNMITGTITADISSKLPAVTANLTSPFFDLRSIQSSEPLAAGIGIIGTAQASQLVPNTAVPYDLLQKANADLNLNIKRLIVSDAVTADNVKLIAGLKNGILNIKPLELDFGSGSIDLNAVVNANTQSISLTLNSKDVLLQDLHKEFIVSPDSTFGVISGGKTTLNVNLSSQGKTTDQLTQNLKGQSVILVSESEMQTGSLQFLTGNFISQLLSILNIDTSQSSKIKLQCAVIRTDFDKGKAVFPNGIAVQSDKLVMSGNGNVNLINDKIDFSITPSFNANSGITQALSSLIKIEGTTIQPKIRLDDKQALKTIVGVATTGAAAYIGSQTLFSNSTPCYTALAGTSYQNLVPAPSAAEQAAQNIADDTSAAVKASAKAVKQEIKNLGKNAKEIFNLLKGN